MRTLKLLGVLALAMVICLPGLAGATVVNFDDLTTPISFNPGYGSGNVNYNDLPSGYAGFTWSGDTGIIEGSSWQTAYQNTPSIPSSPNAFFGDGAVTMFHSGGPINVTSASVFTFPKSNGLVSFGSGSSAKEITITGYLGATQVGSAIVVDLTDTTTFHLANINLNGIDKIVLTATPNAGVPGWFMMDNFTYTPVPLPPSVMLLGSGLMGLGLLGWRRKRS
jgi:hypothetical protein